MIPSRRTVPGGRAGTIACYGPDNTRATKLVAAAIGDDGDITTRTWVTDDGDVREDRTIAAEVAAFLGWHRVTDAARSDRIIGCPHQEGTDYPMGRVCPSCPFWADIDRFTHEPRRAPRALMSPAAVLETLAADHVKPPLAALESADAHREALVEPLLQAIDRMTADPDGAAEEDGNLFPYALYVLAKWREPRAHAPVLRWLTLPGNGAEEIGGDIVTQDGDRILAAVYDGDLDPIKALILDASLDEYCRSAGLSAMALLGAWGEIPLPAAVESFAWLAREGLPREPGFVWDSLAVAAVEIEATAVYADIRRAYDERLLDEQFQSRREFEEAAAAPRGQNLDDLRRRRPPIDDVAQAIAWWGMFERGRKVGRNEPCPCGSGRKFKKCCGAG